MISPVLLAAAIATGGVELRVDRRPTDLQKRLEEAVQAHEVETLLLEGALLDSNPPVWIGWDRVRTVTGEWEEVFEREFASIAENAWRARIRLAREDYVMAEPLLEPLFEDFRGKDGPTALLVCEGLLECRLERDARHSAFAPWLETLRLRRSIHSELQSAGSGDIRLSLIDASASGSPLDVETGLVPALGPIFLPTRPVQSLANDGAILTQQADDPVVRALAAWTRFATERALGIDSSPPTLSDAAEDPGVALYRTVIQAQEGPPEEAERARTLLKAQMERHPGTWREAWARAAVGRSLLRQANDPQSRAQGMIHLLHLPARFASEHPSLARLALAEVSAALAAEGEVASAAILREDLKRLGGAEELAWLDRFHPEISGQPPRRATSPRNEAEQSE